MAESTVTQDITGEVLNTIRKSQTAIVEAIERWATTVQSMRPDLPDLPFADTFNIADRLPKPEELVRNAYDFAEQLLASQRKFAEDVLKATAPLLPSHSSHPTAKSNGKPAAK